MKKNAGDEFAGKDLIEASLIQDNRTVSVLLKNGVNINTVDPDIGYTALHIACMQGNSALVKIILKYDDDTNAVDYSIRTYDNPGKLAWQLALENRHVATARLVQARSRSNAVGPRLV